MKKKIFFTSALLILGICYFANSQNKSNEPTLSVALKNDSIKLEKQKVRSNNKTPKIATMEKSENSTDKKNNEPRIGVMEKKED